MPNIRGTADPNTVDEMSRTLAHELGHSAGLFHPFDTDNDVPEINNDLGLPPDNKIDLIKNNLMNTPANPINKLRSKEGTELIPEQRAKIKKTVESQQAVKEIKK